MPQGLVSTTQSWDASAPALLKTASEGPTTILNEVLLEKINTLYPFSTATSILDTGCGVAQILGRLISTYGAHLPPSTRLIAADLSPGMIATVNSRKALAISTSTSTSNCNTLWSRVETLISDASDLSACIPSETFSHIFAGLLLFMVERPRDVLQECLRVLKDGGIFGLTSFRFVEWMDLISHSLDEVRPGTKLPDIPVAWASTSRIREQLEGEGFKDVVVEEVQTWYEFEDAEAMTRFNVENIPSVKMVTEGMTRDEVERAIQWMIGQLKERFPGGKGRLEGIAIVGIGRK